MNPELGFLDSILKQASAECGQVSVVGARKQPEPDIKMYLQSSNFPITTKASNVEQLNTEADPGDQGLSMFLTHVSRQVTSKIG